MVINDFLFTFAEVINLTFLNMKKETLALFKRYEASKDIVLRFESIFDKVEDRGLLDSLHCILKDALRTFSVFRSDIYRDEMLELADTIESNKWYKSYVSSAKDSVYVRQIKDHCKRFGYRKSCLELMMGIICDLFPHIEEMEVKKGDLGIDHFITFMAKLIEEKNSYVKKK